MCQVILCCDTHAVLDWRDAIRHTNVLSACCYCSGDKVTTHVVSGRLVAVNQVPGFLVIHWLGIVWDDGHEILRY